MRQLQFRLVHTLDLRRAKAYSIVLGAYTDSKLVYAGVLSEVMANLFCRAAI